MRDRDWSRKSVENTLLAAPDGASTDESTLPKGPRISSRYSLAKSLIRIAKIPGWAGMIRTLESGDVLVVPDEVAAQR